MAQNFVGTVVDMAGLTFPEPPLRGGGIVLRPWREDDVPAIVAGCSDAMVSRFISVIPSPYTEEHARSWLADQAPSREAGNSLDMAIADPDTDEALGAISAEINRDTMSASVGYWLRPEARGRGYAASALAIWCEWLFDTLALGRIELTTDPENIASQRVAERCGFENEGLLRSFTLHVHTGERRDALIWSLLPGEAGRTR